MADTKKEDKFVLDGKDFDPLIKGIEEGLEVLGISVESAGFIRDDRKIASAEIALNLACKKCPSKGKITVGVVWADPKELPKPAQYVELFKKEATRWFVASHHVIYEAQQSLTGPAPQARALPNGPRPVH